MNTVAPLPCQETNPEAFYGPADSGPGARIFAWEWKALEYCWACPVVSECLAEALTWPAKDQHGVIGGMTAGQRRAVLLRPQRRGTQAVATLPDVDPLTVEHLVAGVTVPGASLLDVAHAAVRLYDSGMDATQVANQLGCKTDQVLHWTYRRRDGKPLVARTESAVAS